MQDWTNVVNGDQIQPSSINGVMNAVVAAGNQAEKLALTPDTTNANQVGTPTVTIDPINGNFIFAYLKGERGETGSSGTTTIDSAMSDTSANAVQNNTIKAYVDNSIATAITTALNTAV